MSWVPDAVFSAGGGRGSVEAWCTAALDIEEVLTRAADSDVHFFVADVLKSFHGLTGGSWIGFKVVLGCLPGSAMLTSNTMLMLGYGLNLLLVLVSLGHEMVGSLRGAL